MQTDTTTKTEVLELSRSIQAQMQVVEDLRYDLPDELHNELDEAIGNLSDAQSNIDKILSKL